MYTDTLSLVPIFSPRANFTTFQEQLQDFMQTKDTFCQTQTSAQRALYVRHKRPSSEHFTSDTNHFSLYSETSNGSFFQSEKMFSPYSDSLEKQTTLYHFAMILHIFVKLRIYYLLIFIHISFIFFICFYRRCVLWTMKLL